MTLGDDRIASERPYAAEEMLDGLLEAGVVALVVDDRRGRIAFASDFAARILGYGSPEGLLGRDCHRALHDRRPDGGTFPRDECPLHRAHDRAEPVHVELDWFARADGTYLPVSYDAAPVAVRKGHGAFIAFRDVSEHLKRDEALRECERDRPLLAEVRASQLRIVQAADAKRRRLVRNLHDGAQRRLFQTLFSLQLAREHWDDPPAARRLLDEALEHIRLTVTELRDLASGIHPAILTDRGLAAAVDSLADRLPVIADVDVTEERFAPSVESAAYFVVAEALTNCEKHAAATLVEVRATSAEGCLLLEVADDGVGGADVGGGNGLAGLADRVSALGGSLSIESPPGHGTRIRARIPLSPASGLGAAGSSEARDKTRQGRRFHDAVDGVHRLAPGEACDYT